jgi:ATP phosphoribosyltransferase regulatory subunit
VFERWDYDEIIPPIFDYYDVFAKGMGAAFEDTLYRFIDREGNILALRPSLRRLVAKSVATRLADHPKALRLCLLRRSARYEAPRGGRQREFFQIGVEHIGRRAHPVLMPRSFWSRSSLSRSWASGRFQINLGEMGYFSGIVERMNLSRDDLSRIKTLVDLKDTVGLRLELERLRSLRSAATFFCRWSISPAIQTL